MSCSEWKKCALGDLVKFQRGHDLSKTKMTGEGYIVAGSNGVIGHHNEYTTEEPCITIGRSGNVGTPYYYNEKCWAHNTTLYIKEFYDVDPKYIYYYLKTLNLGYYAGGSAVPTLNRNHIHPIEVYVPSDIKEQKRISNILSSLDEKIELNNEMNKTLEEMAQALFKRWFVDFEFPNEDGEPYKTSGGAMIESELGMIPKGWKNGMFNDISEKIYSGGTPKTSEESYWNGELSWMSSGETRNNFVTNTEKSITSLGAEKSSTKLANKYDTVIASAGQGFTRGQTSLLLIDTYVNQSLIVIKSNKLFKLFNYINIKMRYDELRAISDSHSIRGSLTTKMISALSTIIPEKEILLKFNKIVESLIMRIENNINNTNGLIELRDSLLPRLMSGEIRMCDTDLREYKFKKKYLGGWEI